MGSTAVLRTTGDPAEEMMMKLGYFPGCSLHATAREFDESLRAIATALQLELDEIHDWSCCGASSGHATNHLLSIALAARNLALSEAQGHERVIAPCAMCYSRLATARHELAGSKALSAEIAGIVGRPLSKVPVVQSIVEALRDLAPQIGERAKKPLTGLKVACYYGCLLVRPPEVAGWDDAEAPGAMEQVARAAGAQPVVWNKRLECCGAGFSLSRQGSVIRLGRAILEDAHAAGAHAVVVACPMCHSNLDFRQQAIARTSKEPFTLPVLYLTQLVGLALGIDPRALGLERHFVSTRPFVELATAPRALDAHREGA